MITFTFRRIWEAGIVFTAEAQRTRRDGRGGARPYRAVRFGVTIGPHEVGALKNLFAEPAGYGAGEGSEKKSKHQRTGAAADEFAIVGGRVLHEWIGDRGENCPRDAVEQADDRPGADAMTEVGQDSHEKTDGGVGKKKAGSETRGRRKGQTLKPWADGGEEAKAGPGSQRTGVESHGLTLPATQGRPKEKSLREFLDLPSAEEKK